MEEVLNDPHVEEQRRWMPAVLLATALARVGELDLANGLVEEGLAEARRSDFRPSISQWCVATGNVRGHQGQWDEARAAFDEARTIARTGGATFFEAVALHDFGLMEVLAGNHA